MKPGRFISFEGGEGVGKSTNIKFAQQFLESNSISVVLTREPGGTPVAEKIRDILLEQHAETLATETELFLLFAARAQHLKEVILPALAAGKWVLTDRFTDASYAYQGGGRNMPMETIAQLEQLVQAGFQPDLTILLDAPVEIGLSRAKQRGKLDRFEIEQQQFFERVRQVYLQRAAHYPARYNIIDASLNLNQVQVQISQVLLTLL